MICIDRIDREWGVGAPVLIHSALLSCWLTLKQAASSSFIEEIRASRSVVRRVAHLKSLLGGSTIEVLAAANQSTIIPSCFSNGNASNADNPPQQFLINGQRTSQQRSPSKPAQVPTPHAPRHAGVRHAHNWKVLLIGEESKETVHLVRIQFPGSNDKKLEQPSP